MKYYKLTDERNQTKGGTQWGEGITHKAIGKGKELCSPGVIHVYDHPLKAVMFNPIHADFTTPHLWEVRIRKVVADDGLKVGVKSCTTIKEIPLPEITTEQRVRFAIYCALEVYKNERFLTWAQGWLNSTDRTEAAWAAAWAAEAAEAAARSAEAARSASRSAARAAEATQKAVEAAGAAARSAAEAAAWTPEAAKKIDFVRLIKKAMKEKK